MNISRFRYGDIQSWWEVPGIAYFCSLFRTAFNLLDFDIEELEEALLTDGTEESASSLLTELIVRLLNGCLGNNDISAFNYQMYLRRLFRQKCQETGRYNPFNTDIDFQFLPLRTKVEILYALCDFRLDAEDVFDLFKNLEAESLRVEPLGWDDNYSAYWYFYGTRLYREDIIRKPKGKNKKKKLKESKRRSCFFGDVWLDEDEADRVWQVVCFTEEDWTQLTEKFSKATSKVEKELYRSLSQNFLPEIPRLFLEKERLQRKRLLELVPRRTSNRVQQKTKKEEESKQSTNDSKEEEDDKSKDTPHIARENRAKRRNLLRSKSASSDSSANLEQPKEDMPQKVAKRAKSSDKRSKNSSATHKGEPPPDLPVKTGRKTNNSLASVTGQILIPENDEPVNSTRKKLKTSQIFSQTEEDIQTDMYKVLEQITAHEDAWPFMDPVEEEYAPNYYAVIRRPMDLHKMEERLDSGHYTDFSMFKADFKLIVNNCRLYNGQDNEYTTMVDNLQVAFDRLTEKYMHRISSSDEEIAVEYQLPTPSRKHKLKPDESPERHKLKKRKSNSDAGEPKSSASDLVPEVKIEKDVVNEGVSCLENKKSKESHKSKQEKDKKKHKGHHRHGKHSKNHKKASHKTGHGGSKSKHSKKQKHKEGKSKERKSREGKSKERKSRESKSKEGKSKEGKSKEGKSKEGKSKEGKSKEGKSKEGKSKDGKSKEGKNKESKSKESKSKEGKTKESKTKEGKSKEGKGKDGKNKEGKSKEGKKSKQKKKKSKRHAMEIPEATVVKIEAPVSPESSHRSRSASPLPSIHTPSPSPTELDQPSSPPPEVSDQLSDPDFFKDKYDKIKERRRHAAKDAFESLFDLKQKVAEKHKHHVALDKDKHQKLRETIEKLKAKNDKYKETSTFKDIYSPGSSGIDKPSDSKRSKESANKDADSDKQTEKVKVKEKSVKTKGSKKGHKKSSAKNESASEALEEAVKYISKWLEEPAKSSAMSSPCDSPATNTISTEEQDSRQDDELSQGEKSVFKKESVRKRPSSREPKVVKRREIQRTIERLQPGKSKGNLLTNISNKNSEKTEEIASLGVVNKVRETDKSEEASPKLSLGSVLPTVNFTLGKDHNFDNKKETKEDVKSEVIKEPEIEMETIVKEEVNNTQIEKKVEEIPVLVTKKDAEVETEPQMPPKPNQEKATPNLSAWFKAFGAPKNPTPTTTVKKKTDDPEAEEKHSESTNNEHKQASPKNTLKYDSPTNPETPNPEGGDSPVPVNVTPRQRRASTGSSVSERSSFSQDLDSPRHQMSHTSPLLRSPASPRTEEFQKITYPIINGSVRAGFYQDTTSIKSSPEKSCSPREGPQSPYSAYPQHVYVGNNPGGASTPNYFVDHNKSPLPTYTHLPPPYYDTTKGAVVNKPPRTHEDYTNIPPETFQQNQYGRPYSPVYSPYTQPPTSNYAQVQQPPQPPAANTPPNAPLITPESKTAHFPVKKRMYNEPEQSVVSPVKTAETKESMATQVKTDYPKIPQTLHSIPLMTTPSVDDIALALSEKSEMAKLRENNTAVYATTERHVEDRNNQKIDHIETAQDLKKDMSNVDVNKPIGIMKKDNIDMVNMGYMNPEIERRSSGEAHESDFTVVRDVAKPLPNNQQKIYDVDVIALNLGINSQPLQKTLTKSNPIQSNVPPAAHSQENAHRSHIDRCHTDMTINHNVAHAHHPTQFDHMSGGQSISNFSMSDIELANKKLYSCNAPTSSAIDYGNWKMTNQMRQPEMMPSDYSTNYNTNTAEKLKNEINAANSNAINYNKNLQHQQYNMFNVPRANTQRTQDMQQSLPAELRIPNPRGLLKNDHVNVPLINDPDSVAKTMDSVNKSQKPEKLVQNHPLVSSNPYKTPYSNSGLPLDSLRNLPNIPQMLERYTNDDRFLSSFAASSSSLYHEKQYQMAQMFNKSLSTDLSSSSTPASIYSQSSMSLNKDNGIYKTTNVTTSHQDPKPKTKRKRTESKTAQIVSSQSYHGSPCTSDVLSSVKSGIMPASAFNFGTSSNMATNMSLSSGLYGDNAGFSANQLMAANYMVAAVAHQQRSNEASVEKLAKPAHQNSSGHAASSFPFIGHGQVRGGYPFVGADPTSPLYQQYLQRHQEELLRQTGAQIMSLYPGGYPASLGARQPYDTINRHWL